MATTVDSTMLIVLLSVLAAVLAALVLGLLALGAVLVVRCRKAQRKSRQADAKAPPAQQARAPSQQQQMYVHQQQQRPQRPSVAEKPIQKKQPPNQPQNRYEQRGKAGQEPSFKDASFADPSGLSGASGSADKGPLSGPSHDYSLGNEAFAKGGSGISGAGASGSANYPGPRAQQHDYSSPTDFQTVETVGGHAYDGGTTADQQDEGEPSSDPTYDKLHAYHPPPNPESATATNNA